MFARTLRTALAATTALAALSIATQAHAQTLPSVSNAGGATITQPNSATLNVNLNDANRTIQWSDYSVSSGASVNYVTSDTSTIFSVLNRVTGANYTDISGAINSQSNINVWVVNTNGIIVGNSAAINVGGLVLTSAATNVDTAFANSNAGNSATLAGGSGAVTMPSGGTITAARNVVFLGSSTNLNGTISAGGTVAAIAAQSVTFPAGVGSPLSYTINTGTNFGQVRSDGVVSAGDILLAGKAENSNASDLLYVANGSLTATASGGGNITLNATATPASSGVQLATIDVPLTASTGVKATSDGGMYLGRTIIGTSGDVTATATGALRVLGNVTAGGAYAATGSTLTLGTAAQTITQAAAGAVTLTASSGALSSNGALAVTANSDGVGTETLALKAPGGAISMAGSTIQGGPARQSDVTVSFSGDLTLGNVTAARLSQPALSYISTAGAVTLGNVTTTNSFTLQSTAGALSAGTLTSTSGSIDFSNIGTTQSVSVNSASAAGNLSIRSYGGGAVGISGAVTAGSDYIVQGGAITLGNGATVTQQAGNAIQIYGSGLIKGMAGLNLVATQNSPGALLIYFTPALAGIDFTGTSIVAGQNGVGDINFQIASANAALPITFGTVQANRFRTSGTIGSCANCLSYQGSFAADSLTMASDAHVYAASLTTGPVSGSSILLIGTNGATVNGSLTAATSGSVGVNSFAGNVSVTGDISGSAIGSSAGGTGNFGGTINAGSNVTLSSTGAMSVAKSVTSTGGWVRATGSALTLGTVGQALAFSATSDITLTANSGALTANGTFTATSNSDGIGTEALTLKATAGAISMAGSTLYGGAAKQSFVTVNAGGDLTLGNVTANYLNGADINGKITVGDVTTTGLIVLTSRLSGVTAGMLTSEGAVLVSSRAADQGVTVAGISAGDPISILNTTKTGTVTVSGPVSTESSYTVSGGTVILGNGSAITQQGGSVSLTSYTGPIKGLAGLSLQSTNGGTTLAPSAAGVDLAGIPLTVGAAGDSILIIDLRADTLAAPFTLGDVVASHMQTIDAASCACLLTTGAVTTGALTLRYPAAITADSVTTGAILADGAALTGQTGVTVNGAITVPTTVSGSSGTVQLVSSGGNVAATGAITAGSLSATAGGSITLNAANLVSTVTGLTGSGGVSFNNTLDFSLGPVISSGPVAIRTTGDLTLADQVTGGVVALSANRFINNRGSDAIVASDHWVVYSANPANDVFNGLDSNNTPYWNRTVDTLPAASVTGNRYVFTYQPTLTVTTTGAAKTYGDDLSASLSGMYTVSGLQPGMAGVYLADSAANAYSGTPAISSAGAAANAPVAGGPYAVTANQGSFGSPNGYALVFANNGQITVNAKAITGTAAADNKTYDGTTAATGAVTLNGVVDGDAIGTTATVFAFRDPDAGTGKIVDVSGTKLTGAAAGNYTLTVNATTMADILAKVLTATLTANTKTYDGTAAATGTVTLAGVVDGETIGTTGTSFAFRDKNAGAGKTVDVTGTKLTGATAGNYTLSMPATTLADILAKAITGAATANSKTYDGALSTTGTVALSGVLEGDTVGTTGTSFVFRDRNAGTGKTVDVTGTTLTGAQAGNYTLTVNATALADILAKAITGTPTATNKTYDGTTAATGSVTLNGVVEGDTVGTAGASFAFRDKNAGAGKTVDVTGTTLTGAQASNYTLTVPATTLADILAKAITGTAAANNKTYDGTTAATGTITLSGVIEDDTVGTTGASFAFRDKNAGAGKTVDVTGTTLTGAQAGNYTLTVPATTFADILAKAITGTATANNKTYDGTTAATGTITLSGVIEGDTVGTAGASFAFRDKNAGTGKTVDVTGTTLTGAQASNYTLTVPATTLADILAKAITGTATATSKTYDGTTSASGSVTLIGVIQGDTIGTTGTVFAFRDKNAGTGKIVDVSGTRLTGVSAGNYTLTVPATTLGSIAALPLVVSADDKTKPEGGADPALTFTLNMGLIAGDNLTGSLSRLSGEAPGAYAITQGTLSGGVNYLLSFVPGTLVITPAPASDPNPVSLVPAGQGTSQLPHQLSLPSALPSTATAPDASGTEEVALCGEGDKNCAAASQ